MIIQSICQFVCFSVGQSDSESYGQPRRQAGRPGNKTIFWYFTDVSSQVDVMLRYKSKLSVK